MSTERTVDEIAREIVREYHKTRVQPFDLHSAIAAALRDEREAREKAEALAADAVEQIALIRASADYHKSQECMRLQNEIVARVAEAEAERDEAQSACTAWRGVFEVLEAHLMDRVAMRDQADPERYLSILRSSAARVDRDSKAIVNARWADAKRAQSALDAAEAEVARLREALGLYRDAVRVDVTMEGLRFAGANSSALRRAWKHDHAALSQDPTPAAPVSTAWPYGCPKRSSCARHTQCMYNCKQHRDRPAQEVRAEIETAIAQQDPTP